MNAGGPKGSIAARKLSRKPPRIAGSASGSVICQVVRKMPEPRVVAASSSSEDISSRLPATQLNGAGIEYSAITKIAPWKLKMLNGPCSVWKTAVQMRFSQPELGAARKIQASAPRKEGVT